MMKLTVHEVSRVLDAFTTGSMSRTAVEQWAAAQLDAFDPSDEAFVPGTEEHRLWEAVIFLSGIALETSPAAYLHSDADVAAFRERTGF